MQNENNKELIPLFPSVKNNKVFELVELNTVLNGIKSGNYNLNNIIFSRKQSNKLDYQTEKEQSKQTYWGYNPQTKKFSGFVFIDIDLKPEDNLEFTKNLIHDLSFIKSTWVSFGGKGIGALAYCSWIKNADDYKLAYLSLTEYIKNNTGLELDPSCSHHHRYNTISFDENILIKDNIISFNELIYVQSKSINYDKYIIDNSLIINPDFIYDFMKLIEDDFYFSQIITDLNGIPILYNKQLVFNPEIHKLSKYIKTDIISNFEYKNRNNTMAYSYQDFACSRINIQSEKYFAHGRRAKILTSLCINLLISNPLSKYDFSKSLIYNYLTCLNTRCVKFNPEKNETPIYLPLSDEEINKLSSYIFQKFENKSVELKISTCKSIRTNDFDKQFLKENPDYIGNKHVKSLILKEINNIKNGKIKTNHVVCLSELFEKYPNLSNEEYIEAYSIEQEISLSYSKEIFYKFKKVSSEYACDFNIYTYNHEHTKMIPFSNPNFIPKEETLSSDKHTPNDTKIQNAINDTYFTNKKITQNEIMERTGLSIITIKRYWSKYKDQVKLHNNSIIK